MNYITDTIASVRQMKARKVFYNFIIYSDSLLSTYIRSNCRFSCYDLEYVEIIAVDRISSSCRTFRKYGTIDVSWRYSNFTQKHPYLKWRHNRLLN